MAYRKLPLHFETTTVAAGTAATLRFTTTENKSSEVRGARVNVKPIGVVTVTQAAANNKFEPYKEQDENYLHLMIVTNVDFSLSLVNLIEDPGLVESECHFTTQQGDDIVRTLNEGCTITLANDLPKFSQDFEGYIDVLIRVTVENSSGEDYQVKVIGADLEYSFSYPYYDAQVDE